MTKLISRNTVTWLQGIKPQRDPKKDVIQQEMKLWNSHKILSKKNQHQKFQGCRVGCYSWWSEGIDEQSMVSWLRCLRFETEPTWPNINEARCNKCLTVPKLTFQAGWWDRWDQQSVIWIWATTSFWFWFWLWAFSFPNSETTCGQVTKIISSSPFQPAVNLLGDSYEEVANLLDVPGQSAGSEHPGLWRRQEAFYQSLIFTKIMLEMKWKWWAWHFHQQKICQPKRSTTKKELLPLGSVDVLPQVSDRWPRITTCWESYFN